MHLCFTFVFSSLGIFLLLSIFSSIEAIKFRASVLEWPVLKFLPLLKRESSYWERFLLEIFTTQFRFSALWFLCPERLSNFAISLIFS